MQIIKNLASSIANVACAFGKAVATPDDSDALQQRTSSAASSALTNPGHVAAEATLRDPGLMRHEVHTVINGCPYTIETAVPTNSDPTYLATQYNPQLIETVIKALEQQPLQNLVHFRLDHQPNSDLIATYIEIPPSSAPGPGQPTPPPTQPIQKTLVIPQTQVLSKTLQETIYSSLNVRRREENSANRSTSNRQSEMPLEQAVSPVPFINNEGNTCFLSAMTWVHLLNNPVIRKELPNVTIRPKDQRKNSDEEDRRIVNQTEALRIIRAFVAKCDQAVIDKQPVTGIAELRTVLHLLDPQHFGADEARQHDAHEAWTLISDLILENSNVNTNSTQTEMRFDDNSPSRGGAREKNTGRISIPVNGQGIDLANRVANYFMPEQAHPYSAGRQRVVGEQTNWEKPPEQLEINLKRFRHDGEGTSKILTSVEIPLHFHVLGNHFQNLKDAYPAGSEIPPVQYQLYGAIRHHGDSPNSGHYTAVVRKPIDGVMHNYLCDDSGRMLEITDERCRQELLTEGYDLLYMKIDGARTLVNSCEFANRTSPMPPPAPPRATPHPRTHSPSRRDLLPRNLYAMDPKAFKEAVAKLPASDFTPHDKQNMRIYKETLDAANDRTNRELQRCNAEMLDNIEKLDEISADDTSKLPLPEASENFPQRQAPTYVMKMSTNDATQMLVEKGYNPLVQIMANDDTPGGGVLTGADAQEEVEWRTTTLPLALLEAEKQGHYNGGIGENGILVPGVTHIRKDPGANNAPGYVPLPNPFRADHIVLAAERLSPEQQTNPPPGYEDITRRKITQILRAAVMNGNDSLVLGAFGCGAFHNNPETIARYYKEILELPEFKGRFRVVVFAVLNDRNGPRNYQIFQLKLQPDKLRDIPNAPVPNRRKPQPQIPPVNVRPHKMIPQTVRPSSQPHRPSLSHGSSSGLAGRATRSTGPRHNTKRRFNQTRNRNPYS